MKKRTEKVGTSDGRSHALQGQESPVQGNQGVHASWMLTSLRESVGKELCRKITKIALQKFNSSSHCNFVHKISPMLEAMKILDAEAAVGKEWEKLKNLPACQMTKVKSKRKVIERAQKVHRTDHSATLMDIYHLMNADVEPIYHKYKSRVKDEFHSEVTQ